MPSGTVTPAAKGGGSTPGAAIVRGPFSFTFATANLDTGVTIYTPTVDDILLDVWLEINTVFDGTTPLADVGTYIGGVAGLYGNIWGPVDLSNFADAEQIGLEGLLNHVNLPADPNTQSGPVPVSTLQAQYTGTAQDSARDLPARVTAANPLKLVVSQNGHQGGTAIDSTQGAGRVYIVTATPVALP